MNNLPTKQTLLQQASANAKAVKDLNSKITTASGAVVGGPAPVTPSSAPASGGTGQ